jgi:HB1, ASXL, restriction endonuclease HTH domain
LNEGERIMASQKTKPKAPAAKAKASKKQEASVEQAQEQAAATKTAPGAKQRKKPQAGADKKLSAIDAAAKVLGESGQALNCGELIEAMAKKGYWTSPGGKTPASTLYASILRELKVRGAQARFRKTERGKFALNAQA